MWRVCASYLTFFFSYLVDYGDIFIFLFVVEVKENGIPKQSG